MDDFVLIVDDNIENLKVVGTLLKEQGLRIAIAKSGKEALQMVEYETPSLILMDVMMPEMNGYEVCRILRQNKAFSDIPIIFLTALSEIKDIVVGFESGGTDYVTKPFNSYELNARVKNQLDLKKSRDLVILQSIELQKLTRTQNQIFSIISHDMRTPLASLNMLLDNMVAENASKLPSNVLQTLNLMEALTKEAYQMLDNMLHWTRFQMKQITPAPVLYKLDEQIMQIIRLYEVTALHKNIALSYNPCNESLAFADENMIHIVLRNLVSNAIKYSPKDSEITISIKVDPNYLIVEVADRGKGMDNETFQKALSDFDFCSQPGTQGEKGTGLGLKICSHFIKLNEGTFEVASTVGKGSVFSVSLPRKRK